MLPLLQPVSPGDPIQIDKINIKKGRGLDEIIGYTYSSKLMRKIVFETYHLSKDQE